MSSSERQVVDVVVVGGGPAGSVAALELARGGFTVVVLERELVPREKVCGEYLCPAGVEWLGRLDVLDQVLQRAHRKVTRIRIVAPGGAVVDGRFTASDGTRPFALSVARQDLDDALLGCARRAGAQLRLGARAVDVVRTEHGVEVRALEHGGDARRYLAQIVIGADGRFSVVASRL